MVRYKLNCKGSVLVLAYCLVCPDSCAKTSRDISKLSPE